MIVIPTHYKVAAGAALAALCAFCVWSYGEARFAEGQESERALVRAAKTVESELNRKLEADVSDTKENRYDEYIKARDDALADAKSARSELDRLRGTLARYQRGAGQSPTTECRLDEQAALARSLESCGERHQEVARDGELDAQQVIGLQNYIQSIAPICIRNEEK